MPCLVLCTVKLRNFSELKKRKRTKLFPLSFQNVPPAILLRFLREHRSEWADSSIDFYAATSIKVGPCGVPGSRVANLGGQVILPLAHSIEHEEASSRSFCSWLCSFFLSFVEV